MKVWSWRQAILRAELEPSSKLLLLALSTYMNDHGEGCYPSVDQICRDTGLSERTIFYHLKKAEAEGFLVKDKRDLPGKKWASNEYRAALPEHNARPGDEKSQPIAPSIGDALGETAIIAPPEAGVQSLHPTVRGEPNAPHNDARGASIAVMGCNDCSDGVQPLHTNSPMNSPFNSKKDISPETRKNYPDEFERFWVAWPKERRCEKPHAYVAWWLSCKKIAPDALLETVKRYLLTEEAMSGFAPYPAKWLKNERWLEFEEAPEAAKPMPTLADLGGDTPENRGLLIVFEKLKERFGEAVFRSWFHQLRIGNKNCSVLTLHAPTRFVAEHVTSHFADEIQRAVAEVWPEITDVNIEHGGQRHGDL